MMYSPRVFIFSLLFALAILATARADQGEIYAGYQGSYRNNDVDTIEEQACSSPPPPDYTCNGNVDYDALAVTRRAAIETYMTRLNSDIDTYVARCERYYVDDSALIIRGVGAYEGYDVVLEYGYLAFGMAGGARLVAMEMHIDNATLQWSTSAEGVIAGDADDTVTFKVDYTFYAHQDPVSGQWALAVGGLRNTETLLFAPCTDRVIIDYSVNDPDIMPLYVAGHDREAAATCDAIMARCTGSNRAYASHAECVAFLSGLKANASARTACPFPLSSNTASCRDYHADNALVDPAVHCPHTSAASTKCVDMCTAVCAHCPANSHCVANYTTLAIDAADYSCRCDDGYAASADAQGMLSCTPTACSSDWSCSPSGTPGTHCDSAAGRCACAATFAWDPATAACVCAPNAGDGGTVVWDLGANPPPGLTSPVCMPAGRCLVRSHCTAQAWSRVQCAATEPPDILSPFAACLCNAGFEGGRENPCTCPHGEAAVAWSDIIDGEVCLAPGECAADWDCAWPATCAFGLTEPIIGKCTSPTAA